MLFSGQGGIGCQGPSSRRPAAVEPLAAKLAGAKAEADYGYSGTFKNEEYDDPAPRWREGLIRALGLLGAHDHTGLLAGILNDERSVAEVRLAAAQALADLGDDGALTALQRAATEHPVYCVRHAALDEELAQVETNLHDAMLRIPNLPHPSVPVGASDAENVIVLEFAGRQARRMEAREIAILQGLGFGNPYEVE